MKKLWVGYVSIEFEMAIYAETKEEALKLAKKHTPEEVESLSGHDYSVHISDHAPSVALDDSLPWGDFGSEKERTVGDLKEELGMETGYDALMRQAREVAAKEGVGK